MRAFWVAKPLALLMSLCFHLAMPVVLIIVHLQTVAMTLRVSEPARELLRFALVDDGLRCSSLTVTYISRMAVAPKMRGCSK